MGGKESGQMEGMTEDGLNVTFTTQLLMHGKQVSSIIRKKGESVQHRQQCVSFSHTTPSMCLNTDLERLLLEGCTIQGQ
uniref:Uncharacterized protein n=1 Tax=Equus asinus TaxID=9793 RepID=A0A9L0JK67_EQUAS